MTVPVIRLLLQQYPELRVTMVSTAFVAPLFRNIDRLQFHAADLKGTHAGFGGLFRLSRELKKAYDFDAVADLHNVLRTKVLRAFFAAYPKAAIDKGRQEKKAATRQEHRVLKPLKTTFQRYADVFAALGLPLELDVEGGKSPRPQRAGERRQIGIAPFAQYEEKMYPAARMKEVLLLLSHQADADLLLFGGRNDAGVLEEWAKEIPGVRSIAGTMSFEKELDLIATLDLMVSMDSANMHFASLYGVPVVSIWGGTHPWLGFYGWGQDPANAVQAELDCRPSSVFGNKPCPRQGECMRRIPPAQVVDAVLRQLNASNTSI